MDFERSLETQRLRLLRILAGLVVVVGFLSVGPVSRGFSIWACGFVGSILARAEMAARYLVVAQARSLLTCNGAKLDRSLLSDHLARVAATDNADVSLSDCRKRLNVLRAVLMDLPRHAARLIRRIEKHMRRALGTVRVSHFSEPCVSTSLDEWHLPTIRIERPPDKGLSVLSPVSPPLGTPAGGENGWAVTRS